MQLVSNFENINMTQVTIQKLSELTEIAIGYQHRERVSHAEHGSHRLIQVKDVYMRRPDDFGADSIDDEYCGWRLSTSNLDRVTPKGDPFRYEVTTGDILFVCRGSTNIAIPLLPEYVRPFPNDWKELLPAYVFYILRPKPRSVLPEYLAWFINQSPAQTYLNRQARGSLVQVLPKSVFEELEVALPAPEIQSQICAIERLRAHEEYLLGRLQRERSKLAYEHCLAAIRPSQAHPKTQS